MEMDCARMGSGKAALPKPGILGPAGKTPEHPIIIGEST